MIFWLGSRFQHDPEAKGQPDDSLTRHHPAIIPRTPNGGASASACSLLSDVLGADPDPAIFGWVGDHPLDEGTVRLLDLCPAVDLCAGLGKAVRQRIPGRLQLGQAEHARPAGRADGPLDAETRRRDANSRRDRAPSLRSGGEAPCGPRADRRESSRSTP